MTRAQLEHIIRAACAVADDSEVVVVGSQAILFASRPQRPALTLQSVRRCSSGSPAPTSLARYASRCERVSSATTARSEASGRAGAGRGWPRHRSAPRGHSFPRARGAVARGERRAGPALAPRRALRRARFLVGAQESRL